MHVMARQIQRDEPLEQNRPLCVRVAQKTQQTRRRAAVRHHVEYRAELCRLVEFARGVAVECVEETRDAVEEGAVVGVVGHEVEGGAGEDDAGVACGGGC